MSTTQFGRKSFFLVVIVTVLAVQLQLTTCQFAGLLQNLGSNAAKAPGSNQQSGNMVTSDGQQGMAVPLFDDETGNIMDYIIVPINGNKRKGTFNFLKNKNSKSEYGNYKLSQGDVAINKEDFSTRLTREIKTWKDGILYYEFDQSVNKSMVDLINLGMKDWEDHTCLEFKKRSSPDQIFFMKFRTDMEGCFSFVGKQFKDIMKGQDVNLGDGCENLHTVIHEIGHAIGLSHEQSRSDRDQYIKINTQNIEDEMVSQFEKSKTLNERLPYDFKSVMQYPSWGFSKEPYQKITMATRNPMYQYLIDEERLGLSFKDIKVVNLLYECDRRCDPNKTPKCQNGGFAIPYKTTDKSKCICMCPNGYEGNFCEKKVYQEPDYGLKYYGGLRCGGNITKEEIFQTPGYPKRKRTKPGCSWWIRAPPDHRVAVKFEDFSFREPETESQEDPRCENEKVEIRYDDLYDPVLFCGQQLKGQTVYSDDRDLIIVIVADIRQTDKLKGRGLKAKVKFVRGNHYRNRHRQIIAHEAAKKQEKQKDRKEEEEKEGKANGVSGKAGNGGEAGQNSMLSSLLSSFPTSN